MILTQQIQIGDFNVQSVIAVKIVKNADMLSDTATIELPAQAYNVALEVEKKILRGDPVSISLGYDGDNKKEFQGFVYKIETAGKIIIHAEDAMFVCRKPVKNISYPIKKEGEEPQGIAVKALIEDLVLQVNEQIDKELDKDGKKLELTAKFSDEINDLVYDKYVIDNQSTAWEQFKRIQKDWALHIYIRDKELHVRTKYSEVLETVAYDFSKNVEKSALKYRNELDKKVLVELIGLNPENKTIKATAGKKGGDKITLHKYDVSDQNALQLAADEELKNHSYSGYEGSIDTWLLPYVSYGYHAEIKDDLYEDRAGTYYVESVVTSFSASGGKRKVKLGVQIDAKKTEE